MDREGAEDRSTGRSWTRSAASPPRRRSSRTTSSLDGPPRSSSPPWVDIDKDARHKARAGRATARKDSGISVFGTSASSSSAADSDSSGKDRDSISFGFLPKLGRITEGREHRTGRRRTSMVAPASEALPSRRLRRSNVDVVSPRKASRQKHGSLQRLGNLDNPSLISVLSELTQQSKSSSGSNSTVTQKSYGSPASGKEDKTREAQNRKVHSARRAKNIDGNASDMFQYTHQDARPHSDVRDGAIDARSSTSPFSTTMSSEESMHEDTPSSDVDDSATDSPLTSPASARLPEDKLTQPYETAAWHDDECHVHPDAESDSDDSTAESEDLQSHAHHMQVEDVDDGSDAEDEQTHPMAGGEMDDGAYHGHSEHTRVHDRLALERAAPPRIPSATSSRHSDPYSRRLRNQERELRAHVLESPQPHRDFQFAGGPSPHVRHTMPLYDPYSENVSGDVHRGAQQPPAWPPPAPAPPQISYYSPMHAPPAPYVSEAEGSHAVAARPPLYPPASTGQQGAHYSHQPPPHYQPRPSGLDLTTTTVVGYEKLAHKLTEASVRGNTSLDVGQVVPVYRKFEQLNHRILLHLQDEIVELEEELRHLDECIAQLSPRTEHGKTFPASRRGDARYGGELHYRRTELLGRVFLKLGQYNQALSSFSTMVKTLDAAKSEDIDTYRRWIEQHSPIESSEARFLERQNDLLAVSRRRSASFVGGAGPHHSAAVGLPLIAMLPLMAFAIVPSLLGRLFIITLIGAGEVAVVTSTELIDFMSVREWSACASV